jgi:hypothetical protein
MENCRHVIGHQDDIEMRINVEAVYSTRKINLLGAADAEVAAPLASGSRHALLEFAFDVVHL